jgi:two-component system cell cycle sensor histidine kinase/response regulator CckA
VATAEQGRAVAPSCGIPDHARATILLVEDEAFVRDVACEVLESAGYRVLAAKDAVEAVEIFEHCSRIIQLLITDLVMPGSDGRTLAHQLTSQNSGLKVIVSSGYPERANDVSSNDGHTFFLPKPFCVPSLLAMISRVLGEPKPQTTGAACGR